jgi:hypothetical protein
VIKTFPGKATSTHKDKNASVLHSYARLDSPKIFFGRYLTLDWIYKFQERISYVTYVEFD